MNPWYFAGAIAPLGAGLYAWGALYPGSQVFGPTLRHSSGNSSLGLTFDDGPNMAITPHLLTLLDRYQVKATFFLIGKHVRACPDLAREVAARGHSIGNHTETHPSLLWMSRRRIIQQLSQCQDAIEQATGQRPTIMRPPFGERGPQLQSAVRQAGLHGVAMWSLTAFDWKPQPAERLIRRLRGAGNGDVIVLHDGDHLAMGADRLHLLKALEFWLPRWRDDGLKFVTLDASNLTRA